MAPDTAGRFKGKNVVVTGGAGFIGSNVALRLVDAGASVTVLDAMLSGLGGNPFNLEPARGRLKTVIGQQSDPAALERVLPGADYVFNLAGNVSHLDSMRMPFFDLEANSTAQLRLLEACRELNRDCVIVYASTRQIYGTPRYLPVDENHPIAPVDVNGINKFSGEQFHALYAKVHGLKTVALRLTNTYGPRQLIRHSRQGFIGWFVNRAVTGQPIQLYGSGKQVRDFNAVDDVVEAMLGAALEPRCHGQVYNLAGERADLDRIATLLVACAGKGRVERIDFPTEAKKIEIGDFYGASDRLKAVTGWVPRVPLEDGLRTMVAYYEKNLSHYLDEA